MTAKTDAYIIERGLVATEDPKLDRPVFRSPGFDGITTSQEMDEAIAQSLREHRVEQNLSRAELAQLLGSLEAVYGRYERSVTKLHATQVLHLCEVLDIYPDDLLFEAAPHLWGDTREEAQERRRITKMIQALPRDTLHTISSILDSIFALQNKTQS
jgi:transcriptional regulator with XRE-family HTH domain